MKTYSATGRRKNSIAQVRLTPGKGLIKVNDEEFESYFDIEINRVVLKKPLTITETEGQFDVSINVRGGGKSGQTGAVQLGIARALVDFDEELKPKLRSEGLLTRDPRMVERKKYGRKKARKRFQFSKR
jgi:small subunit ribosomal protein S9